MFPEKAGIDAQVGVLDKGGLEAGEAREFLGNSVAFLGRNGAPLDELERVFGLRELPGGGDGLLEVGLEIGREFFVEMRGGSKGGQVGEIGQVVGDIGAESLEIHHAGEDDEAVDE